MMVNGVTLPIRMFVGSTVIQIVKIKKKLHESQPVLIQPLDEDVKDGTLIHHTNQTINL